MKLTKTPISFKCCGVAFNMRQAKANRLTINNSRVAPEENRFQKKWCLNSIWMNRWNSTCYPVKTCCSLSAEVASNFSKNRRQSEVGNQLPVFSELEDGLPGLAVDPDYQKNHWFICTTPVGKEAIQRFSRFNFVGDSLERKSEKIFIDR